jgi:hypothetical protein
MLLHIMSYGTNKQTHDTVAYACDTWVDYTLVRDSDAYIRVLREVHAECLKHGFAYVAEHYAYPQGSDVTPEDVQKFYNEITEEYFQVFGLNG